VKAKYGWWSLTLAADEDHSGRNCSPGSASSQVVKIKLSLCEIKHHEDVWRIGGITPLILKLYTRLRWLASFTPRSLYQSSSGSQSQSGRGGKEKYPSSCREFNPGHTAHSLVTVMTELSLIHWLINIYLLLHTERLKRQLEGMSCSAPIRSNRKENYSIISNLTSLWK
jgi:hypothetical protein